MIFFVKKKKCYIPVTLKSFSARKTKSIWVFFNILSLAKTRRKIICWKVRKEKSEKKEKKEKRKKEENKTREVDREQEGSKAN